MGHRLLSMAPITLTQALGQAIKDEADRQGLSIRQVAGRAGIPNSTLARSIPTETAPFPRPLRWNDIVAVAIALNVTASDLASRADALVGDAA